MSQTRGTFDFIFDYVDRESYTKYFRLVVAVCGYIIVRGLYQKWATKFHIQQEVNRDNAEKAAKPAKDAELQKQYEEKLQQEAKTFGWGKKTRRDTKLKQAYIEDQFNELRQRHQSAYDAAEDHDIEYLLED
ncbi:hypothetical protein PSN45_005125 [Yamadazyma tenuis]|uniref:Processing of GAS1 and ALP protein 2 n=1 Tax=Candida tenuis (strain ATCC 10573 / BCRC 21748 / CBS 615 / JCM 9827 / NBRC 10315 / NRRL Y-1498 / VKM Y-70) TaxID=590646 RepID=G3B2W3_CANTC|nr:uncharacterized protein CANTEDRAFT_103460 [Yamadazyma tenuis ATCC 10573]EGV64779.1 hypothetical protein CANTEDRAFT_103460 [Yamadazyma tenuis ATCC 10573]WEJ97569.1 hypothetical protein PSN45_005125 [Yamadazyma tenuis]